MSRLSKLERALAPVLVAAAMVSASAAAQGIPGLSIHASGGISFGVTDGPNAYESGTPDNSLDLRSMTLTVLATPSDRLLVGMQAFWGVRNIYRADELEVDLTQAFAQYKVSDALKVRTGLMRQPFGIYSETLEIGTLRPFLNLPRGVYSPGVFQWDGYRGLGLTGVLNDESRWPVEYDLYTGELSSKNSGTSPVIASVSGGSSGEVGQQLRNLIGVRVRTRTPVEGLTVGISGYSAVPETPLLGLPTVRQYVYLGTLELLRNRWSLRSEYGHRDVGSGGKGDAAYVETAFRPVDRWELAARWDWLDATLGPRVPLPPFLSTVLDHRDVSLGVNYRVVDGLVLMASVHQVRGNFAASPLDGVDFAHGETLDRDTRLFQCGAQFSF